MKKLLFDVGGRPRANDDMQVLQDQLYAALQASLSGAPAMVLSGCQCSANTISAGYVWIGGNIEYFAGASGVAMPVAIVLGAVELSDERPYQTGGSKACMSEQLLQLQDLSTVPAGRERVACYPTGPVQTYEKWQISLVRTIGEVQWLAGDHLPFYDGTGKGYIDRPTHGWALCNGQNGTADLRGRFIVGLDPGRADYSPLGKTGGSEKHALSVSELPEHGFEVTVPFAANPGQGQDGSRRVTLDTGKQTKVSTNKVGGNQEHENRPPYYTLIARQWIGY